MKWLQFLLLSFLRAYKLVISPFLGQNCRFYPSCSVYADTAIRRHGVVKGSVLAGRRLCKCHPWHPGGVDPVPEIDTNGIERRNLDHGQCESGLKLARLEIGTAVPTSMPRSNPPNHNAEFTTE
jgi:putative membrane protein insertion efficiency factor